jgi:hypothetical protein
MPLQGGVGGYVRIQSNRSLIVTIIVCLLIAAPVRSAVFIAQAHILFICMSLFKYCDKRSSVILLACKYITKLELVDIDSTIDAYLPSNPIAPPLPAPAYLLPSLLFFFLFYCNLPRPVLQ